MIPERVEEWLLEQHGLQDEVEKAMRRRGTEAEFPIIGPLVGRAVQACATAIGARRVFEMGSGFGYSTWWFGHAVGPKGEVVHTDGDAERSQEAAQWMEKAGLAGRVRYHVGDAIEALEAEKDAFDVVFIDIDKGDYPRAWKVARSKVRVGGLVIADNVLWSGKVADPGVEDAWTEAVRAYVRLAMGDAAFVTTVVPLRDGVAVSVRVA